MHVQIANLISPDCTSPIQQLQQLVQFLRQNGRPTLRVLPITRDRIPPAPVSDLTSRLGLPAVLTEADETLQDENPPQARRVQTFPHEGAERALVSFPKQRISSVMSG